MPTQSKEEHVMMIKKYKEDLMQKYQSELGSGLN